MSMISLGDCQILSEERTSGKADLQLLEHRCLNDLSSVDGSRVKNLGAKIALPIRRAFLYSLQSLPSESPLPEIIRQLEHPSNGRAVISSHHDRHREWLKADLVSPPARMLQRSADVPALAAHGSLPDHVA